MIIDSTHITLQLQSNYHIIMNRKVSLYLKSIKHGLAAGGIPRNNFNYMLGARVEN